MKKILLVLGLLYSALGKVYAQSIPQLVLQLELDVQKLTQMKNILQDMYRSYRVIEKGYAGVKGIIQDNFNLHQGFLDGLLEVSPAIGNDPMVGEVKKIALMIVDEYNKGRSLTALPGPFSRSEQASINGMYASILDRCGRNLDELQMVLTPGLLRMSDGDRSNIINQVYERMVSDLSKIRSLSIHISLLRANRNKESGEINAIKGLYHLIQ